MRARILVTRPQHDAQPWVDALRARGLDAAALPLMAIGPCTDPASQQALIAARQAARTSGHYRAVMFVSGNAVQYFFAKNRPDVSEYQGYLAINTRSWTPGPGTARALLQVGAPATRIVQPDGSQQFDAAALWQTLKVRCELNAQFKLLIITGEDDSASFNGGSAAWVAGQVAALGAYSAQLAVYRRYAPEFTVAQAELAQAAASNGSMWLFTSSQAIQNLQAALPDVDWRGAYSVATHPRIAQTARAAGFSVHECLPTLNDIVHTLHQLAPIASAGAD